MKRFVVCAIVIVGAAALGLAWLMYWSSIICGGGNALTWLFRDREGDAAEAREMAAALANIPAFNDLIVVRVNARQIVLRRRADAAPTSFSLLMDNSLDDQLRGIWQSIYIRHHRGSSLSTITNLSIADSNAPDATGFGILPHECTPM